MAFNRKARLAGNIEAIRTAFALDREQRVPTAEERQALERYCGFGGLKCILNPAGSLADAAQWTKSDLDLFAPTAELHRLIRENSPDERTYKRYMDSLKSSVLTAFYTPAEITETISSVLKENGIAPLRVLEPSAGRGAFVDAFLKDNPQAEVMAFEKDLLTGKILSHLYPEQRVRIEGLERIEKPFEEYFDVAVSNVPFGDVAVFDAQFEKGSAEHRAAAKKIHNYFCLKTLDTVRDGGIVALIIPQGVLNADSNSAVRRLMLSQADLLSAVRMPNNLFTENAGTEAGCDLLVLQKHADKRELSEDEKLLVESVKDNLNNIPTNAYFLRYPDRIVHTEEKRSTDLYGKPAMVYLHEGGVEGIARDLRGILSQDIQMRLDLQRYGQEVKIEEKTQNISLQGASVQKTSVSPVQTQTSEKEKASSETVRESQSQQAGSPSPMLTLFDLWEFTVAEKKQTTTGKKQKREKAEKTKTKPKAKEKTAKSKPKERSLFDAAPKKSEANDLYAELDWETNPPINGFYEVMMDMTPEQRARALQVGRQEVQADKDAIASRERAEDTSTLTPSKEEMLVPRVLTQKLQPHYKEGTLVEGVFLGLWQSDWRAQKPHTLRCGLLSARSSSSAQRKSTGLYPCPRHLRKAVCLRSRTARRKCHASLEPEHLLRRVRHALRCPQRPTERGAGAHGCRRPKPPCHRARGKGATCQVGHLYTSRVVLRAADGAYRHAGGSPLPFTQPLRQCGTRLYAGADGQ